MGSGDEVVKELESAWGMAEPSDKSVVSDWATTFLECPKVTSDVWKWIVRKALDATQKEKITLVIGVFELLSEPGHDDKWLKLLFSLLDDPRLRWVFLEVYELRPADFYRDLAKVEGFDPVTAPE